MGKTKTELLCGGRKREESGIGEESSKERAALSGMVPRKGKNSGLGVWQTYTGTPALPTISMLTFLEFVSLNPFVMESKA